MGCQGHFLLIRPKNAYLINGLMSRPNRGILFLVCLKAWEHHGNRYRIGVEEAAFVRPFYQDPDLQVDRLAKITCPVLILLDEKDDLFIEPARIMATGMALLKA